MLRKEMETEESEQCKKLSEGYIRLIKDVGSREALTRRFFLIFQYEAVAATKATTMQNLWHAPDRRADSAGVFHAMRQQHRPVQRPG